MTSRIERFTLAERVLHWGTALAMLILGSTGIAIWQEADKWRPRGFNVISQGHFWLGGGLLVVGALAFRVFRRGHVVSPGDRFNPLQLANLRIFQLTLLWMSCSGIVLRFAKDWGLAKPLRHTIAEVHLVSAAAVGVLVAFHLVQVLAVPKNRGILAGMLTGWVDRAVAGRVNPRWSALSQPTDPARLAK